MADLSGQVQMSTKVKDLETDIRPSWKPSWENTPCLTPSFPEADPEMRTAVQVSDEGNVGSSQGSEEVVEEREGS